MKKNILKGSLITKLQISESTHINCSKATPTYYKTIDHVLID